MQDMRDFLSRVLPSEGIYCVAAMQGKKKFLGNTFVQTLDQLEAKVKEFEASGLNIFFATASYPLGCTERKAGNALFLKTVFGDIDVDPEDPSKASTQEEAIKSLLIACKLLGLPFPTIVSSGYGIHFYWIFNKAIPKAEWQVISDKVKQLLMANGVKLDPSRTADAASILRPVGTLNLKSRKHPKKVQLWGGHGYQPEVDPDQFGSIIGVAKVPDFLTGAVGIDVGEFPEYVGPPAIADVVASKCVVVGNAKALKGNVPYPYWWLMVGALTYCEDGERIAHEWSSGYPEYSPKETDQKIIHWQKTSGPPTCSRISKDHPNLCSTCPHFGKITTPVQLGVVHQELAPVVTETGEQVQTPRGFKRTKHGLLRSSGADDVEDVCFFAGDLYIEDVVVTAEGDHEAVVVWNSGKDGERKQNFGRGEFTDARKMWTALSTKGINLLSKTHAEHMMTYCNSYIADLMQLKKSISGHKNMGWKDNGTFVIGQNTVFADGSVVSNMAVAREIPASKSIKQTGNLNEWKRVVNYLNAPSMYRHAFVLLAGFGAPLMKMTGIPGVMINLVGATGQGKSTMQKLVNSMVGDPDQLMVNAKDTDKSKVSRISQLCNLPVCMDEMGNEHAETLSNLLYTVTQGQDSRRLNTAGDERHTKDWCTIIIGSSNHSFATKLNHFKGNADAEKMRLFEYEIKNTPVFSDKRQAADFNVTLLQNYGHAGVEYIKQLTKMYDALPKLINKCRESLPEFGINFSPKERFWEAAVSCALAGGFIARQLGLIQFDPRDVIKAMSQEIQMMQAKMFAERLNAVDLVSMYMNNNVRSTLRIRYVNESPEYDPRRNNLFNLTARIEEHIISVDGTTISAELMISKPAFVEFLHKQALDYGHFKEGMAEAGINIVEAKRSLGKDCDVGGGRVPAIIFDLKDVQLMHILDIKETYDDAGRGTFIESGPTDGTVH